MGILKKLLLNKTFTLNTSSLFFLNGLNFLISMLILPKLISNFGIKGWGEITFFQIIINYFLWIIDWSFPQYACKQISIYETEKKKRSAFFIITRTSQLLLFIVCSFFITLYGLLFTNNPIIYIYIIPILFGSFLQCYWYLNGREKIYETAFFQLLNKLIFSFFVFIAIKKGNDISLYFLYFGITNILTGILCTLRIRYKYGEVLNIGNIKSSIKLIKKSYMLFNSSIIGNMTNSILPFIISSFYSLDNVGLFNIAERIKNFTIQIFNPLSNSIFPRMSKYNKQNKELANKKFIFYLKFIFILGTLVLIILNINNDLIISFFIKEKVSEIKGVVVILTFSFLVNILYESFVNQYLVINNLFRQINKIKITILSSAFILGIPLVYFKGIYGAALTNLLYEIIGLAYAARIYLETKDKENYSIIDS